MGKGYKLEQIQTTCWFQEAKWKMQRKALMSRPSAHNSQA
jgi:hypothetical protein